MNIPPSQTLRANFHGQVGVEIFAEQQEDLAFFADEYSHHRVEALTDGLPLIRLKIARHHPLSRFPAGYTFHQHKILARWGYRMHIAEEVINLDVIGNRLATPMVHHMLVHPSLRYLAANQGTLLLHAGGVVNRGYSILFTGQGGAGKTTTTSLVLATGGEQWLPHADDYVFLRGGPRSLGYITRSHLYLDLLRWVPDVRTRLTRSEKLRLEIFGRVRKWSGERIKWAVRLPVERLWPGRPAPMIAMPIALVFLERNPKAVEPNVHALSATPALADQVLSMNFQEARHFIHLVKKSNAVVDMAAWLQEWESQESQLIVQLLKEIPLLKLELPTQSKSPMDYSDRLLEQISGLVPAVQGVGMVTNG